MCWYHIHCSKPQRYAMDLECQSHRLSTVVLLVTHLLIDCYTEQFYICIICLHWITTPTYIPRTSLQSGAYKLFEHHAAAVTTLDIIALQVMLCADVGVVVNPRAGWLEAVHTRHERCARTHPRSLFDDPASRWRARNDAGLARCFQSGVLGTRRTRRESPRLLWLSAASREVCVLINRGK